MKIIFSTYDDIHNPYYAGGGSRAIHEVAKRLADRFRVVVITANYPGAKNQTIDNVSYKRIGPSFIGPKLGQLLFLFLLPVFVKREQFDIWLESFTPPFSTSCLQLFTNKPVIGLVHMLSAEDMERKYKIPFSKIEKRGLKTYRHFIVLTEKIKEKIFSINKNAEIFIIPNGITTPEDKTSNDVFDPFILFIGRLEYNQKGLDLLIEAYSKSYIKEKLVIAGIGSDDDTKKIKKIINQHKLQEKIIFAGKVEGTRKDMLFRNASAIVVPSRFETFSMVVLEAMAYGKPMVSFDIKGLKWVPDDCMLKVKPFDTDEFGNAIKKILKDKKLRLSLSQAAKKHANKYTWEGTIKKYEEVFKKVENLI
jgi:glycosyltransferase involved in cell wall biosynthesis